MGKDDPKIGEKQGDGSTYAGVSPETGEKLFVMGEEKLEGRSLDQLHKDLTARNLRLPTAKELPTIRKILENAAQAGSGSEAAAMNGWYWSGNQVPAQQEFVIPVKRGGPTQGGPG